MKRLLKFRQPSNRTTDMRVKIRKILARKAKPKVSKNEQLTRDIAALEATIEFCKQQLQ